MWRRYSGLPMLVLAATSWAAPPQDGLDPQAESSPRAAQRLDLTPPDTSYPARTNKPGNRSPSGASTGFAFAQLDTNGNLSIDRSEAAASDLLRQHFAEVDANNDLQITPTEFAAFQVRQMRAQQKRASDAVPPSAGSAEPRPKRGSWPDPTLAE